MEGLHGLADVVLATLRHSRASAAQAKRAGLSPEVLAEVTERFVEAGLKDLVESPPFPSWRQLGVAFARTTAKQRADFGEALRRAVLRWQAKGVVRRFFFMNKPPGLRLRFETQALDAIEAWLLRQPAVARVERSIYLAEAYQFGGAAGANVAHDFHAADSLAALAATYRDVRGTASATMEILSLLVVSDLVSRMTDDSWEAWDVWKRMEITGRRANAGRDEARAMAELVRPFVHRPDAVLRQLAAADRRLVTSAFETNERVAHAMRELAAGGELLFHVREILPFWIIFHWNRWGIANQRALTIGIEGALDPRA